jgi:N-methylhydantoinase A
MTVPLRAAPDSGTRGALGVDVRGTFTDLAVWDEGERRLALLKLPSVRRDPAEGILAGVRVITDRERIPPSALVFVAHGTTVTTNALLECPEL